MKTINRILFSLLFVSLLATGAAAQTSARSASSRVLDAYLTAQSALARDSLKNVSVSAEAIVAAVRTDEAKALPADIAREAELLGKATSLAKARKAFKSLSESLLAYFKGSGFPPGTYYEMYCPTAKGAWLQTGTEARNPYLGWRAATPTWGWACAAVIKSKFESTPAARGSHFIRPHAPDGA